MHVGKNADERDLLKRLVGGAIGSNGNPTVSTGNFYVQVVVTDGCPQLIPRPAGSTHTVCSRYRDESFFCQTGCDADHVLFRDTDADHSIQSFGMLCGKIRNSY